MIEDLVGAGVIDNTRASLRFLADGRLVGLATCNRLLGRYETSADTLRLEAIATTRKMCAPALMHQEARLLELLARVARWRIDATGALWLETATGETLTARR